MRSLMSLLQTWLRPANSRRRPARRPTLRLECLEGRSLPSVSPLTIALPASTHHAAEHQEVQPRHQVQIEDRHGQAEPQQLRREDRQIDRQQDRQQDRREDRQQDRQADRHDQVEHSGNHS